MIFNVIAKSIDHFNAWSIRSKTVDFENDVNFNEQILHANAFRRSWIRLYVSILIFILYFVFYEEGSKILGWTHAFFSFIACGYIIYSMSRYKCPKCNDTQMSKFVSFGSNTEYENGIHPFPTKCKKCGCYLSQRKLLKDSIAKKIE